MRLLINEPPLQVLPSLAKLIGLNEAIFLQQLHYWLSKSSHHRDGKTWVYNTFEDWQKQMPFWSVITLKRIVKSLRGANLIVTTAQYNTMQIDRTLWYTIDYEALTELEKASGYDTPIVSTCYDGKCQVDTTNNQRLLQENIQTTSVPTEPHDVSPEGVEVSSTQEVKTPTLPLASQFRQLLEELRTAKNRNGKLMEIYQLCYGADGAPNFSYLGKVAKQVGGAGYLAQRLWELSVRPPNGDILAYIQAEHKGKAAREKKGAPNMNIAAAFAEQDVPDYIKEMQQ